MALQEFNLKDYSDLKKSMYIEASAGTGKTYTITGIIQKLIDADVDLKKIARATVGYTGADLENLMNEAAIFAARRNKTEIDEKDIDDANIKVMMGPQKKSQLVSEKEKRLTAYHEAGHAVLTKLVSSRDTVRQISIIPRGTAGGYTMHIPEEDSMYYGKKDILNDIVILLGGRVAEVRI